MVYSAISHTYFAFCNGQKFVLDEPFAQHAEVVNEHHAIGVVVLVLNHHGGVALDDLVMGLKVFVQIVDLYLVVAFDVLVDAW